MSDYEEDLDDFATTENLNRPAESMVGAFRAETTDQWTAASGNATNIPPFLKKNHFLMGQLKKNFLVQIQQEMGSRRRFHQLLLGHRLGSSKRR